MSDPLIAEATEALRSTNAQMENAESLMAQATARINADAAKIARLEEDVESLIDMLDELAEAVLDDDDAEEVARKAARVVMVHQTMRKA